MQIPRIVKIHKISFLILRTGWQLDLILGTSNLMQIEPAHMRRRLKSGPQGHSGFRAPEAGAEGDWRGA